MKILLVGGNASLSTSLKPVLSAFADVVTAGRQGCDVKLDLASARIDVPVGVDVVINAAAHFGGRSAADLREAVTVNVMGAMTLGEACFRAGVKHLVQVSSIFAQLPPDSPFHTPYALTKRQGDELLQALSQATGLPLAIIRPSQFYGAGDASRRHQPFLTSMIDKAASGEDIELYGAREARRNFIHVDDVAAVIAQVVRQGTVGTFACQHPADVGFGEIARAAIRAFGSASRLRFLHDKPNTPDNVLPIDETLFNRIGLRPGISIDRGMAIEAERRRGRP